jgi:putative DNA primase/helicase
MTLLERLKQEGVGLILDEGPARSELRKLSESLDYGFDEVCAYLRARGMSQSEIRDLLRQPKPANTKLNGARSEYKRGNGRTDVSQSSKQLVVQRASDITPEAVGWFWAGRLASGKTTLIGGDPGLGKSTFANKVGANVSKGGQWPCDEGSTPKRSVIVLCAEDGAADTIVPRLMAAEADLSKVHIVTAVHEADSKGRRLFNLSKDLDVLEKLINEIGDVGLVTIDPVDAYIGAGVDGHKNTAVRAVLEPISEMADRLRVAILATTHFSKQPGGKALYRFIGSIAHIGSARIAFTVMADTENEGRVLVLHAKNNLAPPQKGLAFRLEQRIVAGGIVASTVCFDSEHVSQTADQALAAENESGDRSARAEATDFLAEKLAGGPVAARDVEDHARAVGISIKTLRRAKKDLGVKVEKTGFDGGWVWRLPEGGQETSKVATSETWPSSADLATLGANGGRRHD